MANPVKQSSSAVAREFLDSLERVTSSGISPLYIVGNRSSTNGMPQVPASYMGGWIDEAHSPASSLSSFPSTTVSEGIYTQIRPNYCQTQNIELMSTQKPLIGYDPVVERLFRSRENVWVHHMKRRVAIDF